ncbi:hypothetical protein AB0A76_04435 [Streptomyces exfoliatus]|uniref:Uncharacterized protein n=1 Tax=Streptomyces exfoliatus TaxID=1905 RepID=A0ABV3CQG5_STREX
MRPLTPPHREDTPSAVEDRLRAALAARAALVTYRDLRRDAPPGERRWGTRRVRGFALAGLGAAAALAAAYLLVLLPGGPADPDPAPPARTPGVSEPTAPATPTPQPSRTPHPVAPTVAPPGTGPGAGPGTEPGAGPGAVPRSVGH